MKKNERRDFDRRDVFNIKKNQVQMMYDRGFQIPEEEQFFLTTRDEPQVKAVDDPRFEQFNNLYVNSNGKDLIINIDKFNRAYYRPIDDNAELNKVNSLNTDMVPIHKPGELIAVEYVTSLKNDKNTTSISNTITKQIIGKWTKEYSLVNPNYRFKVILVAEKSLGAEQNYIDQTMKMLNLTVFYFNELIVNKSRHFLVPQHKLLTKYEAYQYLLAAKVERDDMLKMSIDDTQARYYGAEVGDIIRIFRDFSFSSIVDNKSVAHRLVVDNSIIIKRVNKAKKRADDFEVIED